MAYGSPYLELKDMVDHWCGICQSISDRLCRNYVGCKDYHHFNICEDCARKEGYLW